MPRSAAAAPHFVDDEPILKFEESAGARSSASAKNIYALHPQAATADNDPYGSLKLKQEELLRLRQKLESTERETSRLEAQRRKEDRFDTGRREISEQISRSLVRLDRELYNSQKAIEEITAARDLYQRHLDVLRSLQPEAWQRGNLDGELDRAIAAIEDAEVEFCKTSRRLAAILPGEAGADSASGGNLPRNFGGWFRAGLAFTLPVILAVLIALVLFNYLLR